ncbi:biotin synthase, partial [Telmatospirillum siberiense]
MQSPTPNSATAADGLRHDWSLEEIEALFALAFNDLLYRAMTVHRE